MAEVKKTEVTQVQMEDGRTVGFAGKKKVDKTVIIDSGKISVDGTTAMISEGAVVLRMDFVNGATRSFALPLALLAQAAGHGISQKMGDNLASPASNPLSPDDMVLETESLAEQLAAGNWTAEREGGGAVGGASIVVKAIMEASGKDIDTVKAFLKGLMERKDAQGNTPSRKQVYDSFKKADTKTGRIIARMEAERLAKESTVDADSELATLGA